MYVSIPKKEFLKRYHSPFFTFALGDGYRCYFLSENGSYVDDSGRVLDDTTVKSVYSLLSIKSAVLQFVLYNGEYVVAYALKKDGRTTVFSDEFYLGSAYAKKQLR